MIVIADATPLNYFVLIGHADILPALFGCVIIGMTTAGDLLPEETETDSQVATDKVRQVQAIAAAVTVKKKRPMDNSSSLGLSC